MGRPLSQFILSEAKDLRFHRRCTILQASPSHRRSFVASLLRINSEIEGRTNG
jgi:hypothetical protein